MASALPAASVTQVLPLLAETLSSSPHLEFLLHWLRELCGAHGAHLQSALAHSSAIMPAIRALQKVCA